MNVHACQPTEPANALPGATRQQPADASRNPPAVHGRPTIRSADLLGGATAVEIEHLGQTYRLQTTRAGKLILTK